MKNTTRIALGAATAIATLAGVVGAAGAVPTSAAPATGEILNENAASAIDGEYVVTMRKTVRAATEASSLAERYDGDVEHVYKNVLNGFAVKMPAEKARELAADPAVESVEANLTVRTTDVPSASGAAAKPAKAESWGLDRIDQRDLPLDGSYKPGNKGENVTAYIIDTGIRISHKDFGGRASYGPDIIEDDGKADDCNGHGTHVAANVGGATYGVAKDVKLKAVRVLDCEGGGALWDVIHGVDWVTKNAEKPAVANMSLGVDVPVRSLIKAVGDSIKSGVTYAVAAGNEKQEACWNTPGRVPEAITVGASTNTDERADFSNFGSCIDIFAPGKDIKSAWIDDDTATKTISGTSMASPHVAGAAAMYLSKHPDATPKEVRDHLFLLGSPAMKKLDGGTTTRLLYTGKGEAPALPKPCSVENTTPVKIPDEKTVTSKVEVSGCGREGSLMATVELDVEHEAGNELRVNLTGPSKVTRMIKSSVIVDDADDLKVTIEVDLSQEAADGTWTLELVDDGYRDEGTLKSWKLNI